MQLLMQEKWELTRTR